MLSQWIGKVVRSSPLFKAVRVSVVNMALQERINVYYNKETFYWAADPNLKCQVGDMVLIEQMSAPQSQHVRHAIKEIVFPVGHIIDPVTGRRCKGTEYLDEENRKFNKLPLSSSK